MRTRASYLSSISLIAAYWTAPVLAAESPDSSAQQPGKQLFHARCGACHLASGGGTVMLAKRLGKDKSLLEERKDLLPLYIRTVVRQGVGSMPWFTRTELPDADLNAIADYLGSPAK
jgi:mono/diheme cytochrome c family protein